MNFDKMNRIMEWFWLVVGIVSTIAVIVYWFIGGQLEGGLIMAFPCLAFLMFFVRRFFRKRFEQQNQ